MFPRTAILSIAAGLLMGQGAPSQASEPSINHVRTIQAIAACGVPAASVRITYEDELQSDLVRIGDLGGSDEARFQCLRKAIHPSYIVDGSAAPQREAYDAFTRREDDKLLEAQAREWLKTAGLLDRVPRFDARKGLNALAREAEVACSVREGSALEAFGGSALTFRLSFLQNSTDSKTYDQFACLMQMIAASDADRYGVRLMLIGNEAHQTETQR